MRSGRRRRASSVALVALIGACGSEASGIPGRDRGVLERCFDDGECDDGIECTIDACRDAVCIVLVGGCDSGACDPRSGCVDTSPCEVDDDCVDDDPCTVAERCQSRSHTCTYDVLDEDGDGFIAASCGGIDCQDGSTSVPTTRDLCDEMDNDCDGEVDEDDANLEARLCLRPL